ncbi:acyl-CoA carboxylase subunit epsilon [Streptomyces sp. NPDC004286]|uniref:acyl-CoA carboxylase subunit epsilon n=1 Tax=Streptomyces sp. NPDC004286 TaxID=3364696 RepID=UPI003678157C
MSDDILVRVECGTASPEELAAVTVALLARAGAGRRSADSGIRRPSPTGWQRLERRTGFRVPHSWQG